MLNPAKTYDDAYNAFRWQIPDSFNIADVCCTHWAAQDPTRIALTHVSQDGMAADYSYDQLEQDSNRCANALAALGIERGDRVGVFLPQSPETLISHLAIYKLAAIAVPLALLFGPDALAYRVRDASTKTIITTPAGLEKLHDLVAATPELSSVIVVGADPMAALPDWATRFEDLLLRASAQFTAIKTAANDPALMIYTSGTTGQPKGALHGHRVLLGHLPGMQLSHDFLPQPTDKIWSPADWAWAGGLLNVLLPSLMLGVPVVSSEAQKFDPEVAFQFLQDHHIINAFIPPTALKMMRTVENPQKRFDLKLRSLASAGEALGADTYEWGQEAFGLNINDCYGQTECNLVLGSCAALGMNRAGAIGRTVPGHKIAILSPSGEPLPVGETGEIAIHAPDPVLFLGYWKQPEATTAKFVGSDRNWFTTGDQAWMDDEGFVTFVGREDDIISSAGYRIGPSEVEDCLLSHPAIALAAIVGKPDELRNEIVKAYVVLHETAEASDALAKGIQNYVRQHLSAHAYPREISFRKCLPLTTSGKIIRRQLREEAAQEINKSQSGA